MYRVINYTTNSVYGDFLDFYNAMDEAENQHEQNSNHCIAIIDSDLDAIVQLFATGKQVF